MVRSPETLQRGRRVKRASRARRVAVDLPAEDESAGWEEHADAVVEAIGDRRGVVVVGARGLSCGRQAER